MKKIVLAVLSILCSATMVAGFASCDMLGGGTGSTGGNNSSSASTGTTNSGNSSSNSDNSSSAAKVTYELDSSDFDKVVKYKSALAYGDLTLEGSDGTEIAVTAAMLSGDKDTDSVGNKELKVTYGGETFSVNYTVKYEVKFMANGELLGEPQYVLSASEIVLPQAPEKEEATFEGWQPAASLTTLTDNVTFTAQYEGEEEPVSLEVSLGEGVFEMPFDDFGFLEVVVTTNAEDVTWTASVDNKNISIEEGQDSIDVTSLKAGVSTITVRAEHRASGTVAEASRKVVVTTPGINVVPMNLGDDKIEELRTLGRTEMDGTVSEFPISVSCGNEGDIGEGFFENLVWETSDARVVVNNNKITLRESTGVEMVTLQAQFVVDGETYDESNAYSVRCVFDGVNVDTYEELYDATKAEKVIVLDDNISFPTKLADIKYDWMHTTYDDTYYENVAGKTNPETARIKTLLQFKNDLYGNGYEINAHNATAGLLDGTGKPTDSSLFRGPLNFVAMSESGGLISVKAQDNVCFALFEGVTVNNVELRGCDLVEKDGTVDLTDLDYIGTTVEVFGDDVNIEYSRLTNGRTVLRVFGDAENATKVIDLNIKNSVLSGAREFILRMGSNCFVQGTEGNESPYIETDSAATKDYMAKKTYNTMTPEEQDAYDEKYIKTFVNIKNSIFKDAGIFAIGIDSHFSGVALHKGHSILGDSSQYWKNLAKTSYGAKLSFEGTVRMYNWKALDDIDSSTLIEIPANSSFRDRLDFNVKDMVRLVADQEQFSAIVVDVNGEDYVHAGIAFFGGGKNYGVFENSAISEPLESFNVALSDVGKDFLTTAAGNEDFYFMLCTNNSSFTPAEQDRLLASEEGYSCIYVK